MTGRTIAEASASYRKRQREKLAKLAVYEAALREIAKGPENGLCSLDTAHIAREVLK